TITGTGRYLKEQKPGVKLVGADVFGSVYYDFWKTGEIIQPYSYKTEGIGEDFFPTTIDLSIIDHVYQFGDKESFLMTRALSRQEGILTGGSGGTAVLAAIKYAEEIDRPANIVVLLPDSSVRYLNKIFDDDWMRENGFLDPEEGLGTIRDLLGTKPAQIITCQKGDKIRDVVGKMKTHGISQIPVLDGHQLAGIVNESTLLDRMVSDGQDALEASVATATTHAYEVVDPDAPVGLFSNVFSQGKVIVVWERGEVRGLVTKIDVIDYLSHLGRTK
ncbi:MAG: pyridoxal-phosphate dependent enzyme, partial [Myxococcales bacterium]|nr:pyridoxal-phosphate dependent enzyme [Myxococcales bacterium]